MWIFYGQFKRLTLPYSSGVKDIIVTFFPGLNKIDKVAFACIRARNAANWAVLGKCFLVWSENDTDPELLATGTQAGQYLEDCTFANLGATEAAEMVAVIDNENMLNGFLHEESQLGRARPKIKQLIIWKIQNLPKNQAARTRELDELAALYQGKEG
jgi:hypothetical protein